MAYAAVYKVLDSRGIEAMCGKLKWSNFGSGRGEQPAEVDETLVHWSMSLNEE